MACTRSPSALIVSILFKYANIASLDICVEAGPESAAVDDNEGTVLTVSFKCLVYMSHCCLKNFLSPLC